MAKVICKFVTKMSQLYKCWNLF